MNRNAARARAMPLVLATHVAERKYTRQLKTLIRVLHAIMLGDPVPEAWRQDAKAKRVPTDGWHAGMARVHRAIENLHRPVGHSFDLMAGTVLKKNREAAATLMGVKPSDVGTAEAIAAARQANIDLMVKAAMSYAADIEAILDDPDAFGTRVEDLADAIEERTGVAESHAELIARDQTLKLNAALNEGRQTAAGVEKYIWSTSKDEKVRPSHQEMDGRVCRWDDPPDVNGDGERLNPGEDFQCRCIALPVLPGSPEDQDEEDEE